jgi:multiple sugar transport system permease protein
VALLFILPALILFLAFPAAATYMVGHLSLFKVNYITWKFVGLRNYTDLLTDMYFWRAMVNNLLYIAIIVPVGVGLCLITALILSDFSGKVQNVVKFALYIPMFAAGLVIAQVWEWIFAPQSGLANYLLSLVHLPPINWFGNRFAAICAVSMPMIISVLGVNMIIALSSIISISRDILDQSRIDGANWWQTKFRVVTPIIAPTMGFISLMMMISVLQMWETIYFLTSGGPAGGSASLMFNIWDTGITFSKYGPAAAKSMVLLVFTLTLALGKKKLEGRE